LTQVAVGKHYCTEDMCEEHSNGAEHATNSAHDDTVRARSRINGRYGLLVVRPTMAANPGEGSASRRSDADPASG
jgi:hypothetical protein